MRTLRLEKFEALKFYPILQVYLRKFNSEFGSSIVNQIKKSALENLQTRREACEDGGIEYGARLKGMVRLLRPPTQVYH